MDLKYIASTTNIVYSIWVASWVTERLKNYDLWKVGNIKKKKIKEKIKICQRKNLLSLNKTVVIVAKITKKQLSKFSVPVQFWLN